MVKVNFTFDLSGRGTLRVVDGETELWSEPCRTGSVDGFGMLVNALPGARWYLCALPVETDEPAMVMAGEKIGWKCRLFRHNESTDTYMATGYLIHPDGGKGGTMGCLGCRTSAWGLRDILRDAIADARPSFIPLDSCCIRSPRE